MNARLTRAPTPVSTDQDGNPIPQAPADADVDAPVHPDGCPPDPGFSFSNVKSTFVGDKSKTVYGQSGVTLSVSVAKGHTWTGTFSHAAKLSESILVASAEETISGSISYTKTTTVTIAVAANGSPRTTGPPSSRRSRPTSPTRELRTI